MSMSGLPGEPALTAEQFERLASYGETQLVREGDVLYATGDIGYDLFLLRTAEVDVIRDGTAADPEHLVYRRGPGSFLGELNLLTGQTVYLTSRVRVGGEIVRLGPGQFRRVLSEQVDVADVLIEALRVRRRLLQLVAGSALEIIGPPDSSALRALRVFAARQELPHSDLDPTSIQGQALMAAHGLTTSDLPAAVIFEKVLRRATPTDVASAIGLTYRPSEREVDLVVVGAGPAGLASAVYGASEGLVTVLLDANAAGGQAATSSRIENYLGFPRGVSGQELTRLALVQAMKFGAQLYSPCTVVAIDPDDSPGHEPEANAKGTGQLFAAIDRGSVTVRLADGSQIRTQAVIVATGARYRRLDLPRWTEFEQCGDIRYSATPLDARDCESRPVTVVGGANSAGQAALFLASKGSRVDLVVRSSDLSSMSDYLAQRLHKHRLVRLWLGAEVAGLVGQSSLTGVVIRTSEGSHETVEGIALFCFIGAEPDTNWLSSVARDDDGFILTDEGLAQAGGAALPFQTSVPRVFAAGDVRARSMKRVAAAVGEGASAVASVHRMLTTQSRQSTGRHSPSTPD